MNLTNLFFRHVVLPGYETCFKRRRTFGYLHDLQRSQWFDRQQIETRQLKALCALLRHASNDCPYYAESWRERNMSPKEVTSLADLQQWPVIHRETILRNRERMRSTRYTNRLITKSTGGSTGMPLRFDLNADSNDRRTAASHRGYEWAGATVGAKQFYLWGVPLGQLGRMRRVKEKLYNWIYRRNVYNSFHMCSEGVLDIARRIEQYRPEAIVAYTSALYALARELDERHFRAYSPRTIVVGAERLYDFQRELIEQVFGAPVFETYGSREFMLIGAECERHEGLHLTMEHLLVEILQDDDSPTPAGIEGNVVITDLYNYGMPFIRYATGDRAVAGWTTCSCGRGLPVLKKVTGRRLDMLRTDDGRNIPGEFFPHLLKDFHGIRRFQVVQVAHDCIELRAILSQEWREPDLARLTAEVLPVLGPAMTFRFVQVDSIDLTASGKHRVVIGLMSEPDPTRFDAPASAASS